MAETITKKKPAPTKRRTTEVDEDFVKPVPAAPQTAEEKAKRDAELDALVDTIDEVLIANAEAFVHEYVQKGGE